MSKGNGAGFQTFYHHHFPMMLKEAHRLVGPDENTCLDIVQEAMVTMIKSIKPIGEENQLKAWVCVVVRNKALDLLRRQHRRQKHLKKFNESRSDLESTAQLEANKSDELSLARLIWIEQQLQQTPREVQHLLTLRFRLGWTLRMIGEHLGLKPGAVDGRIQRAIEKLRLQSKDFDDE